MVASRVPILKKCSYWNTTFTIPFAGLASTNIIYKVYIYGGSPASLGVYIISSNIVTTISENSIVSYVVNADANVVFTTSTTCLAYYEKIQFPE